MMLHNKRKKEILFHVNLLNSLDHFAPIITYFLQNYKHIGIIVYDTKNHKSDFRMQSFMSYENFKYINESKLKYFRRKFIQNEFFINLLKKDSFLIYIYRFFVLYVFKNFLISKKIACCVYDWGPPYRANHMDAILSNIPTVVLPHGTSTTKELAVAPTPRKLDFSHRNIFDLYIFKTESHRLQFTEIGLSSKITKVWGDQRFSKKWCNELLTIVPKFQSKFSNDNSINCLFFVVPLVYGTNKDQFLNLIKFFSKMKKYNFIISIREDVLRDVGIDIVGKQNHNIIVDIENSPSALIEWADIVLDMGSSITIEAIIKKKRVIELSFMNNLQSIFEDLWYIESPKSIDEAIEFLTKKNNKASKINDRALEEFSNLINSNTIDGIDVTEYACREMIRVFEKKISYQDKLQSSY